LNALLNEERAIVSEIAGTTVTPLKTNLIGGIGFRFMTRQEFVKLKMWSKASVSVKRFEKIEQSQVVLYLFESLKFKVQSSEYIVEIEKVKNQFPLKPLVVVINKLNY
jgi:tRNA modification GTPase